MDFKLVKESNLNFIGYSIDVSAEKGENFKTIPAFWNQIMNDKVKADTLFTNCDVMGVVGICYGWKPNNQEFKYMIGIRNPNLKAEGMIEISFGEETFAVFEAVGKLPESIQTASKYIFDEWLLTNTEYSTRNNCQANSTINYLNSRVYGRVQSY